MPIKVRPGFNSIVYDALETTSVDCAAVAGNFIRIVQCCQQYENKQYIRKPNSLF